MGLKYNFLKAEKIINKLNRKDGQILKEICYDIQSTEIKLQNKTKPLLNRCINKCEESCCQNISPDMIINIWNFIYLLILDKSSIVNRISNFLEKNFSKDYISFENDMSPVCFFKYKA